MKCTLKNIARVLIACAMSTHFFAMDLTTPPPPFRMPAQGSPEAQALRDRLNGNGPMETTVDPTISTMTRVQLGNFLASKGGWYGATLTVSEKHAILARYSNLGPSTQRQKTLVHSRDDDQSTSDKFGQTQKYLEQ